MKDASQAGPAGRLPLLIVAVVVAALLAYSAEIHQQVVRALALAEPRRAS